MSVTMKRVERNKKFISYLFEQCQKDKGFAARLRRANKPTTEYQCWDALGRFGIDLENSYEREVFAFVAAALANSRAEQNGVLTLGRAIALSFPDGNKSDQAVARLRRLLACDSSSEVCSVLRPVLTLVQSRVSQTLDYEQLLNDLLWFSDRTKARWAQQFYARAMLEDEKE